MVIKVGYFCTAGYTELGGLQPFLNKIRPNEVRFIRCFPTGVKQNLKVGRMNTTPVTDKDDKVNNVSGYTGERLFDAMIEKLEQFRDNGYWDEEQFDYLLLIDDADCRFNGVEDLKQAIDQQLQAWQAGVDEVFQGSRTVPLIVLFASPEAEAWFVADWQNSFRFDYHSAVASQLHHYIHQNILRGSSVEMFGGAPDFASGQAACRIKLSEEMVAAFHRIPQFGTPIFQDIFHNHPQNRTYSKRVQGPSMLKRIEPEVVAASCTSFFAPVYRQLKMLCK